MASSCALSDWQLDELRALWRAKWSTNSLAALYGVSSKTIQRIIRRMEQDERIRADSSPARAKVD